jgi:DNA-binding PadR family transcriptional regulator
LLCISPAHGWTVANEFRNDRGLGAIWSVGRPLVYRSFRTLEERGLIEQHRVEPGIRGPYRTVFHATPRGQAAFRTWLAEPVAATEDLQALILLKLVLAEKAGITPAPVIAPQKAALSATIESLEAELAAAKGVDWVVASFRMEAAQGVLRFIDRLDERPRERPRLVVSA